jgi:hypothetical protein
MAGSTKENLDLGKPCKKRLPWSLKMSSLQGLGGNNKPLAG